jgi:hypothetical protein
LKLDSEVLAYDATRVSQYTSVMGESVLEDHIFL